MKIRAGFVSNSSSSSFVVKIPKDFVITPENVHELLFNSREEQQVSCYGDPVSSFTLAEIVAADLLKAKPNDFKSIASELLDISISDVNYEDFSPPTSEVDENKWSRPEWESQEHSKSKVMNVIAKDYALENQDVNSYVLSYGDEDGNIMSTLEHGDILTDIGVRISHH